MNPKWRHPLLNQIEPQSLEMLGMWNVYLQYVYSILGRWDDVSRYSAFQLDYIDPFVQEWRPKYSPLSYHFVGSTVLLRPHLETLMPCCHFDIGVFPLDLHPGVYGASAERCRKLEKKSGFWIGRQQQDVWHSHFLPWMTDVGHYGKLCSNTIARV